MCGMAAVFTTVHQTRTYAHRKAEVMIADHVCQPTGLGPSKRLRYDTAMCWCIRAAMAFAVMGASRRLARFAKFIFADGRILSWNEC